MNEKRLFNLLKKKRSFRAFRRRFVVNLLDTTPQVVKISWLNQLLILDSKN